jgi:predicted transcriptional regulator
MESKVKMVEADDIPAVVKALNSGLRRRILELVFDKPTSVTEIAKALGIPQSTATVNVQILRAAKLVGTEPGSRRLLSTRFEEVVIPLRGSDNLPESNLIEIDMPIGLYSAFEAHAPCGLLSEDKIIGYLDTPDSFLDPHRASAQLIWFSNGWLEYPYPITITPGKRVTSLMLTAEVCSEFPEYKLDWPSDITVWMSGVEVGTWTSPGDPGGTRGRLTPEWWPLTSTQYGYKKNWKISDDGCFIDGVKVSGTTIASVDLSRNLVVRIGFKEHAEHMGGVNLFGRKFGNYEHDLVLRIEFEKI